MNSTQVVHNDEQTNDGIGPVSASRLRGFAAMSPEVRRRLGSKGGKTAHERGTANKFTHESASLAGRKPHENGTAHKWTSEEAREAGRKGGSALRRRREQQTMPRPSAG